MCKIPCTFALPSNQPEGKNRPTFHETRHPCLTMLTRDWEATLHNALPSLSKQRHRTRKVGQKNRKTSPCVTFILCNPD